MQTPLTGKACGKHFVLALNGGRLRLNIKVSRSYKSADVGPAVRTSGSGNAPVANLCFVNWAGMVKGSGAE